MTDITWQKQRRRFIMLAVQLIELRNFEDQHVLKVTRGRVSLSNWYHEWERYISLGEYKANEQVIEEVKTLLELYK